MSRLTDIMIEKVATGGVAPDAVVGRLIETHFKDPHKDPKWSIESVPVIARTRKLQTRWRRESVLGGVEINPLIVQRGVNPVQLKKLKELLDRMFVRVSPRIPGLALSIGFSAKFNAKQIEVSIVGNDFSKVRLFEDEVIEILGIVGFVHTKSLRWRNNYFIRFE